ncbi:hypothetical protein RLEG3_25645 [Rhizobium leguminosarum bv. trifolii WSM1689]|nr:hypothetical protein RLEG3_25645 [Rhizobium leguminosarum bv. trifolii WSM1689]
MRPGRSSGRIARSIASMPRCLAEFDDGLASDAVQEAIRGRRVNDAVFDEEDVGAGRLSDLAATIEHHRIRVALGFGGVLGNRVDHPQTPPALQTPCLLIVVPITFYPQTQGEIAY